MRTRHAIGALAALLVVHLAAGASPAEAQKGRRSNLITAEEIAKSSANNAYDAVRTLRPAWFVPRGASAGQAAIMVYIDGTREESLEALRSVEADRIKECRFLDANDATTKYGTGHTAGAIEVTTKR